MAVIQVSELSGREIDSVCRLTWPMPPAAPRTTALTIVAESEG